MHKPLIVIATDLSPESERAFATGATLARASEARVRLVHSVRGVPEATHAVLHAPPLRDASTDPEIARARERLAELAKTLPADLEVDCDVVTGDDPHAALADYASQHGAVYLVIASHGRSGVRRLVLGSVAEGVLRRSRVPVVVVPI